tara:strand:- start:10741 stop:11025 length:285 start_codon:yes stop_codon:yes gene_type:complete
MVLACFLIAPAAYTQDAEDSEGVKNERAQQREARREERQRQIDSLSDEQRQALRERKHIRQARGAGQRSQRPQRRRPQASPPDSSAEVHGEEPT